MATTEITNPIVKALRDIAPTKDGRNEVLVSPEFRELLIEELGAQDSFIAKTLSNSLRDERVWIAPEYRDAICDALPATIEQEVRDEQDETPGAGSEAGTGAKAAAASGSGKDAKDGTGSGKKGLAKK